MKFLHAADVHLGAPKQPDVYAQSLSQLADAAYDHDVSHVLIVGDIFDKPQPMQQIKDYVLQVLLDHKDLQWIISVGNHDYTTKAQDYHSLEYLKILQEELPHVHICEQGYYDFDDFTVLAIKNLEDAHDYTPQPDKNVVLMWHGTVPGWDHMTRSYTPSKQLKDILKYTKASYVALGDIHKQVELHKRVWYSGALTPKTYACDQGYLLVTDKKVEQHRLPIPERKTFKVTWDSQKDNEDILIDYIKEFAPKGSLIKLKFEMPKSTWRTIDAEYIKEHLRKWYLDVSLQVNITTEVLDRPAKEELVLATSMQEELAVLVEHYKTDCDKKRLLSTCLDYLK